MHSLRSLTVGIFGVFILVGVSWSKASHGEPVYSSASSSYFELRDDKKNVLWSEAQEAAERLVYKGARGRLAIVKGAKVHQFLNRNFPLLEETWIGLRFWCKFKKLQWIDGKIHPRDGFNYWDPRWYRYYGSNEPGQQWCQSNGSVRSGYMPVYYLPSEKGYRWQAVDASKVFNFYLVEYPTGKP